MGKSFNDDVFNNNLNLDSINGLNISKEAIEENKEKNKPNIDLSNINLDEVKKALQEEKKKEKLDPQDELKRLMQEQERLKEREQETEQQEKYLKQDDEKQKELYTKKTMIFKQEYLDIIDGLASINDMQIKDVLNQLLEKSINMLDEKTRDKALKTGKKTKPVKQDKSIF
jgi:small-conductance mechanosensitive channel